MDFQLNLDSETVDHACPGSPICVEPRETIRAVFELLKQQSRGAVLICRDGVLEGIFTERDALRLMAEGADLDRPMESVMVKQPVTLSSSDTVGKAIAMMSAGGYRRLPIVDAQNRPLGIVKVSGILNYLVDHFPKVIYTLPPTPHPTTQQREGA